MTPNITSSLPLQVDVAITKTDRIVHGEIDKVVKMPAVCMDAYGIPTIGIVTEDGIVIPGAYAGTMPILPPSRKNPR